MKVEVTLVGGGVHPLMIEGADALYVKDGMYCISVINGHENKITRYPLERVIQVTEWREV